MVHFVHKLVPILIRGCLGGGVVLSGLGWLSALSLPVGLKFPPRLAVLS